jgi:predicted RNase H-like HicB family nuclease
VQIACYHFFMFGDRVTAQYRVIVEQDEDGVFVAEVPSLPGCVSQGNTRSEVLENIKDAIAGYLASLRERGEPVPPGLSEEFVEVT